jgi:hypothetical protein
MKLYTRRDIKDAVGKSESSIRDWFFKNQVEPTEIRYNVSNLPVFFYSQDIFDTVVLHFRKRKKIYEWLNERISKDIICDADLNLIIPSRLNYTSKL